MKTKVVGLRLTSEDEVKLKEMVKSLGFYHPSDWLRSVVREYQPKKKTIIEELGIMSAQEQAQCLEAHINQDLDPINIVGETPKNDGGM